MPETRWSEFPEPAGCTSRTEYLLGQGIVEEPHSFDVTVIAQMAGRRHEWTYSQIEGKVRPGPDQVARAQA